MLFVHLASFVALSASHLAHTPTISGYSWRGYGGDPSHSAISTVPATNLNRVLWSASLDDNRSYYGDAVFMHYASPCITASNTVVHAYRYTTSVDGGADYDNWQVFGRAGTTGRQLWSLNTDYSAPDVHPVDNDGEWTSVYPLSLFGKNSVAAAGGGGTVLIKADADAGPSPTSRIVFYSHLANYYSNPSAFSSIKICTPFTSDANGNLWFGYQVGTPLSGAMSQLGTGGVVRISTSGTVAFRSVQSLGFDSNLQQPALNSAPALSRDGNSVYFGVRESNQWGAYLVKLDSMSLALEAHVQVLDPSLSNTGAGEVDESSAAPMVAPDGHVFYGVFGWYWRESHGWMLQFDGNLNQYDTHGVRYPVGAFGWDDTPSVVPSDLVPSYTGSAKYLILSKYNDYAINTPGQPYGQGVNHVAVLDPTSSGTTDWQTGLACMSVVIEVVGITADPDARDQGYTNAVHEWCINSAAIDPFGKSAIINSEDGHCYRWSFISNTLTQNVGIAPATSEAYTSTVIGPDGTCYAINNSRIIAIGH